MEENYYLLLELFLDPPEQDWNKLNGKIDEKKREWNQKRNRPDGLKFAALCERLESFRDALKDASVRKRQASEARTKKINELDDLIGKVASGDSIAPGQVDQLVKTFQNVFLEKTIRDYISKHKTIGESKSQTLPPPLKPAEESNAVLCESSTLKKIQQSLDVLGKDDVYSALELSRMSSLSSLKDAAQNMIDVANKASSKTAKISVIGELGGLLNSVFQTEKHRKGFEISWSRFKIEQKLKPIFNLRAADKNVTRENFERSVQEITQEGASFEYALWYAYDFYVEKRKCPDPRNGVNSTFEEKTSCPNCFHLNDKNAEICSHCGVRLRVECPKCRTVSFAKAYCPGCGFALGDLVNVKNLLKAFQNALDAQNLNEATRTYNAAKNVWSDNPELQPCLLKLRDLNARLVFEEVEREFDAGRLEAARNYAAKLSFDGGDSPLVSQFKTEFERRYRNEKAFEDALSASDAFVIRERYFDALEQLDVAAKIAPLRPVLIEKRHKIAPFIKEARRELASIRAIQDIKTRESRLNELLKRRPDFSEILNEFAPLQSVENLEIKYGQNGYFIRWKKPPKGDVCFLISARPFTPKAYPGAYDRLTERFGKPAALSRRQTLNQEYESAFIEKTSDASVAYITPVTFDDRRFVSGVSQEVATINMIQNVRTQRCDANVYVSWDWSPDVNLAYILYSEVKAPRGLDDKNCRRIKLTRAEYEREQAWDIRLPATKNAFAKIYQVVEQNGKTLFSPPETLFLNKVYVEYFCEKRDARPEGFKRFITKKTFDTFIKFRRLDGRGGLPRIIFVRQSGRPPLRRDDGEIIATIPASNAPEYELKLDEYFTDQNRGAYFRCYLANVSDGARFTLLDPGENNLQLF